MVFTLYVIGALLCMMFLTVIDENINDHRDYTLLHYAAGALWPLTTIIFLASFLYFLVRGKL